MRARVIHRWSSRGHVPAHSSHALPCRRVDSDTTPVTASGSATSHGRRRGLLSQSERRGRVQVEGSCVGMALLLCGACQGFGCDVTVVRARLAFVSGNQRCRHSRRDRRTSHVRFETGCGEHEDQTDVVADILEAHQVCAGKNTVPPACTSYSLSFSVTCAVPVWTSRISSSPRCRCLGIIPSGGMSSVPRTRCGVGTKPVNRTPAS